MDILNEPIETFTFAKVVEFCKTNQREDVQLDYKVNLADSGLAKHFAAFSNTRGGVIIIGVEEDKKTGLPKKFDGIETNSQNIETIYQWANNVEPLVKIIVHPTDEVGGKRFILIRIYEGDNTPYYVQNDGRLWIRTGNISKDLIDIASPDYAHLLHDKKNEAIENRRYFTERANNVLEAYQIRALINEQKGTVSSSFPSIANIFATAENILTVDLQPNYPNDQISEPFDLIDKVREYMIRDTAFDEFPDANLTAIPEGASFFDYDIEKRYYTCHQVFSQGLFFLKSTIIDSSRKLNSILLPYVLAKILVVIKAASNYYRLFGYQGTIKGGVRLTNAGGKKLFPYNDDFDYLSSEILLNYYFWDIELDTKILFDDKSLMSYFFNLSKKIYWDLGFKDFSQDSLEKYLKTTRLLK